jgi:biopolymer transport protein ExbD
MAGVSTESGDTLSLNLMPMLDIFSILITFLLMSYSTDPVSYDVNSGVELPESTTLSSLDEIPTIKVTKTDIIINDKKVANIIGGDVEEKNRQQGAVYPVFQELQKLAEATKRLLHGRLSEADKNRLSTLTMEMDQAHNFKLMKRIMLAAQQAEYITFKLMVAKQGS